MNIPELIDCGISYELRGEWSRRSNVGRLTRPPAHRPERGNNEGEDVSPMDLVNCLTVMPIRGAVNEPDVGSARPDPRRKTTGDLQNLLVNPGAGV